MLFFAALLCGLAGPFVGGFALPFAWAHYLEQIGHLDNDWPLALPFLALLGAVYGFATGLVAVFILAGEKKAARYVAVFWGCLLFALALNVGFGTHSRGISRLIDNAPLIFWAVSLLIFGLLFDRTNKKSPPHR